MKRLIATLVVALLMLTGCSNDPEGKVIQARFDDVADVFPLAPVMYADITVGKVTKIALDGRQALVTIELQKDSDVPANVIARIRRTSVLGERIIDLAVPDDQEPSVAALEDGDEIDRDRDPCGPREPRGRGQRRPRSDRRIAGGNDDQRGAKGFGGNGEQLSQIVLNFRDITGTFNENSETIKSLIRNIDDFNRVVAEEADAHERAVVNTARALRVLDEESVKLTAAIESLARLATGSRSLLNAHVDEMDHFFQQARTIVGALHNQQSSIVKLLMYAPRHNRNTQLVEYIDFNQVIQDFVICGVNDNPDDPARRCPEADE